MMGEDVASEAPWSFDPSFVRFFLRKPPKVGIEVGGRCVFSGWKECEECGQRHGQLQRRHQGNESEVREDGSKLDEDREIGIIQN